RGHLQPPVTTGIDALERLQVHADVEGQAMEAAAAPHPQAQGHDLGPVHVDAGGALATLAADAVAGQDLDHRLLDPADQLAHAQAEPAQVHHRVGDELAGAV